VVPQQQDLIATPNGAAEKAAPFLLVRLKQ
jgi:hypothetical protein